MTRKEYNGWYNYETWLLARWIDNDQSRQDDWRTQARRSRTLGDLAEARKDQFEQDAAQLVGVTGFWQDLLGAALSEVHWQSIAEHYREDNEDEEQADA